LASVPAQPISTSSGCAPIARTRLLATVAPRLRQQQGLLHELGWCHGFGQQAIDAAFDGLAHELRALIVRDNERCEPAAARLDPLQAVEIAGQGRIGNNEIPMLGGQHAGSRFNIGGIGEACRATSLEGASQREGFRLVAIQKQYLQQFVGRFLYGGRPRPVRGERLQGRPARTACEPLAVAVMVLAETDVPPGQRPRGWQPVQPPDKAIRTPKARINLAHHADVQLSTQKDARIHASKIIGYFPSPWRPCRQKRKSRSCRLAPCLVFTEATHTQKHQSQIVRCPGPLPCTAKTPYLEFGAG